MTYIKKLCLPLLAAGWLLATFPTAAQEASATPAFDAETATEAYLAQMSPEQKERSDSYFEGGYWLQLWNFLFGLGVAWLRLGTAPR